MQTDNRAEPDKSRHYSSEYTRAPAPARARGVTRPRPRAGARGYAGAGARCYARARAVLHARARPYSLREDASAPSLGGGQGKGKHPPQGRAKLDHRQRRIDQAKLHTLIIRDLRLET